MYCRVVFVWKVSEGDTIVWPQNISTKRPFRAIHRNSVTRTCRPSARGKYHPDVMYVIMTNLKRRVQHKQLQGLCTKIVNDTVKLNERIS